MANNFPAVAYSIFTPPKLFIQKDLIQAEAHIIRRLSGEEDNGDVI
jgi:hypothetical protein